MTDLPSFRHALRTPLNHIIGYSEMLIEDAASRGNTPELTGLRNIHFAAQDLLKIIQSRLALSTDPAVDLQEFRREAREPLARIKQFAATFSGPDVDRIRSAAETLGQYLNDAVISEEVMVSRADLQVPANSGRLLVVDDDETNRDILRRQLERHGYQVETVSNGRDALRRLTEREFDLVLLDIVMPEMDGFEVLSLMKSDPGLRTLPVIMISALDEMGSVSRCIEMGADDFVSKPFDRVILASRIGAVVRRRHVELERAELAERLRLLLDSTGEGIFGIDTNGNCTFINHAALKMLGFSRAELLGQQIHDLVHYRRPDGTNYALKDCPMMRAAKFGEASRVMTEVLFRKNGDSFPVEYSSNPIVREGQLQGAVMMFADISERKRTEEKFRQTAKLESLGVLAGGVAHDFNNLLTGILGNASLVLWSDSLTHADREKLEYIVESSERAAELTKQMLAYAGKGKIQLRPVELATVVRETYTLLATLVPKTVRLHLDLADTPLIEGDPIQIQQIVMNLVINAGEAIGEPNAGTVTVKTREEILDSHGAKRMGAEELAPGSYVVLEVTDTGCGMTAETRSRMFDPFYSTKFTGRGLGLAAVHGIVTSHEGAIRAESELGRGSRFEVYLPSSSRKPHLLASEPTADERVSASGLVMIVDDEAVVLKTTQAVLESSGYQTMLAQGGEEAIAAFKTRAKDISVVLLDMMMPGMGGDEVLRYLRLIRHDIPVIVSSGYTEEQVMKYFSGRRVSGFLQKPYRSGKLLDIIGSVQRSFQSEKLA
jgi:PAS domain S-box-containing protein